MTDPDRDGGQAAATLGALRDTWWSRWLRTAGQPDGVRREARGELVDVYAAIEALSPVADDDLVARVATAIDRRLHALPGVGDVRHRCPAAARLAVDPVFADLVAAHEELGRSTGSRPVGALALIDDVLTRAGRASVGVQVPVMAGRGQRVLLAERSGPGWRLDGLAEVEWCTAPDGLAVFALDEGDNEVLALVPVDAPGVTVAPCERVDTTRSFATLRFAGVDLTDADVVTGLHARAVLEDRLTVLAMSDTWGAAAQLLDLAGLSGAAAVGLADDLTTARSALCAAVSGSGSGRPIERSLAVSTAAVHVFPACRRVADAAARVLGAAPAAARLRQRVATHGELADHAWHVERLVPLL